MNMGHGCSIGSMGSPSKIIATSLRREPDVASLRLLGSSRRAGLSPGAVLAYAVSFAAVGCLDALVPHLLRQRVSCHLDGDDDLQKYNPLDKAY